MDPANGLRTLTGQEAARLEETSLYLNRHFLNLKRDKTRARFLGADDVNARPATALEVTNRAGVKRKVFFDAQTYLIVGEEEADKDSATQTFFKDYRPVDGVMEPFGVEIRRAGEALQVNVERVTHNAQTLDSVFDFPKVSGAPLPDIPALLKEVGKNQKKLEELRGLYTYSDDETEVEIDKGGTVHEKAERAYEVFHLGGISVRKLVKKDGRTLSAEEQRKETARVEKIVAEYEKQETKQAAQAKSSAGEGDDEKENAKHRRGEITITLSTFLRACRFVNPRRERFRGQDVIVFDFEAKPDYQPQDTAERLLQKVVGVAWVDERARQLARLEARFSGPFKFAGGFVSVQPGSAFVFEQELVNGELWLPSYFEGHLSAKAFFLAGINADSIHRFSDYKKFRVESVVKSTTTPASR